MSKFIKIAWGKMEIRSYSLHDGYMKHAKPYQNQPRTFNEADEWPI
ncbi:hypothetical protein [Paraglaciecola arctica]|nr:hypothetical protein [Paraglaciecola arctica]